MESQHRKSLQRRGRAAQAYETGVPYLDMTSAQSNYVSNVRICFADQGLSIPQALRSLDVWDCQFFQCDTGIVNSIPFSTNSLHNVLFSQCLVGIAAGKNTINIDAEHVTSDAYYFYSSAGELSRADLTNCIVFGSEPTATNLALINCFFNPDQTNFQATGGGNYYLAANSPLHGQGNASIS